MSQDIRKPITLHMLNNNIGVLPHLCFSDFEATLFQSAFTLAFFALLRVSKVVVLGNKHVTVFNDTIKVLKHPKQNKLVWDHLCMLKNQMLQCLFLIFAEFCCIKYKDKKGDLLFTFKL